MQMMMITCQTKCRSYKMKKYMKKRKKNKKEKKMMMNK